MRKAILLIGGIILIAFGLYSIVVWWWPFFWRLVLGCLGPLIFFGGIILFAVGLSIGKESRAEITDLSKDKEEKEEKSE